MEEPISILKEGFRWSGIFRKTLCRHWMIFTLMAGVMVCSYMYATQSRTEGKSKKTEARSRHNTHLRFTFRKQEERGTIEDKYVVYTCNTSRCGGYASRQKGMVTAYVLSEMLGRKFGISMIRPCDFSEFIVPRDVNWTIDMNLFEGKRKDWFVSFGNLKLVLFERSDLEAFFQKDVLMYTGNIDYVYSLMKNPLFKRVLWAKKLSHLDIFKNALEKLFKLSPKTQNTLNGILGSIGPNNHKLVCAHIRMGKSRTIPRDSIRANHPNQTVLVRFFKQRLHLGRDKLFIATDSDDVRELFRKSFPDSYLEVKGDILHIDKPPVKYECSSMEKVILDQYILSMCDTLVTSISSFSRLAAIMRGTDHELYLARGNNISLGHRHVLTGNVMLLCDYCGNEILPGSDRVTVYDKDEEVRYVARGDHIPPGFKCVSVCMKDGCVKYLRAGSSVPVGFDIVSVYEKHRDILLTKRRDTSHIQSGVQCVNVCVRSDAVPYSREGYITTSTDMRLTAPQVLHTECLFEHSSRCEEAVRTFVQLVSSASNVLSMGIDVSYLYGAAVHEKDARKKKREKRENKIQELSRNVSALRNSNGGYVLIHLVGLVSGDFFTGAFDEFVDIKLNGLIQDGNMFSDVYKKQRLSSHTELQCFHDFLSLFVSAASAVTTSNFNTKIALDDCIIEPTAETLRSFLRTKRRLSETFHRLSGIVCADDLRHVHESRSIEMKGHFLSKESDEELACSILHSFKLAEYITAFTKLEGGGSYLYGVNESSCTEHGYASKTSRPDPVVINNQDYFKKTLEQKIRDAILVCDYDGNTLPDANVAEVHFIPCMSHSKETKDRPNGQPVIMHVSVRSVSGIVFYDKMGPLAYKYDNTQRLVTQMDIKEWIRAFLKTSV